MRNSGQNETAGLNETIMQKRKSPLLPLSFDHRHYGLLQKKILNFVDDIYVDVAKLRHVITKPIPVAFYPV